MRNWVENHFFFLRVTQGPEETNSNAVITKKKKKFSLIGTNFNFKSTQSCEHLTSFFLLFALMWC